MTGAVVFSPEAVFPAQRRAFALVPTAAAPSIPDMRTIFYGYLTVIVSGIVYFSIIGLTHR
jgi:hypothetical protein